MKRFMVRGAAAVILAGGLLLAGETALGSGEKRPCREVILVDAGHGGEDPGMVGINGLQEKNINLSVARKLKKQLEKEGFTVVMTRESDRGLYKENTGNKKVQDMRGRIGIMEREKPVLAVSIHQNSYPAEEIKGPQVFYYADSEEGKKLAGCIQESLNESLQVERPRKEKENRTYFLLKKSPCVLNIVECGFLTNREEAALLQTEEYQEKTAEAVKNGILKYFS